jgi:hypothetical protein
MSNLTVGVSETLHRYVYPPFVSLWGMVRTLTGRERRAAKHADSTAKSAEKKRRKTLWKDARGR